MDDVELRTGVKMTYTSPANPASPATGEPQARYELVLRLSPDDIAPELIQRFRVKEGRLFLIDAAGSLREYDESDFLLIHFRPLTKRDDYTTFEFHRLHWKRVTSLIWEGKHDDAVQAMRMLAAALAQCPDLIYSHRTQLLKEYRRRFDEELENYRDSLDPHPGAGRTLRGRTQPSVPARTEISEAELSAALPSPVHLRVDSPQSPEALLRGFNL
jgi:hypothetical protein